MLKTVYIHLGGAKTGTTSIQSYFTDNRELLLNRYNIYYLHDYLKAPGNSCFNLFPLNKMGIQYLKQKSELSRKTNYKSIVISDESIFNKNLSFTAEDVDAIKEIFPGHDLKIILYIRRADDWCKSLYAQRLRMNRRIPLRTFAQYYKTQDGLQSLFFKLPGFIEHLHRLVGKDNVIVRLYDRSTLKGGSSINDFCSLFNIKLPISGENIGKKENITLSTELLPYIASLADGDSPLTNKTRKTLRSIVKNCFNDAANCQAEELDYTELSNTINQLEKFAPGYNKLFEHRKFSLKWDEYKINAETHAIFDLLYHIYDSVQINTDATMKLTQEHTAIDANRLLGNSTVQEQTEMLKAPEGAQNKFFKQVLTGQKKLLNKLSEIEQRLIVLENNNVANKDS